MLLRHWSLYDAMYYSNYMASHMGIWKESGRKKLTEFLVRLGVPLDEAKQQFQFMKGSFKTNLKTKMLEVSQKFGMDDALINTFIRQIDHKTQLSACDVVYSVSSMLEYHKFLSQEEVSLGYRVTTEKTGKPAKSTLFADEENKAQEMESSKEMEITRRKETKVNNFWFAYSVLAK